MWLAVAACTEPGASVVEQAEGGCHDWGCKANAASTLDGHVFHDHDLGLLGTGGAANSGGLWITGVLAPDGAPMSLEVPPGDLDQLIGKVGDDTLAGGELLGTRILMTDGTQTYKLWLDGIDRLDFWVGGGHATSYFFTVQTGDDLAREPLCRAASGELEGWDGQMNNAVVFRGDRYKAREKTVAVVTDTWINIACAGTAIAKLHLLRHTTAGSTSRCTATQPERQAMLKLLTADYCGDGTAYTEDGTPLMYADHNHWYHDGTDLSDPVQRTRAEAVWNERGAVCLRTPRLFPLDQIECHVQRCPNDMTGWDHRGLAVSVTVPVPQSPPPPPPAEP
jgi:hypothetical protein